MLRTGVDIVEIERIGEAVERWGDRFFNRIFTAGELKYARGRWPQLAGRFAAKEAVMKALGTGVRGVSWREIEVAREPGQAPSVVLHGRAKARSEFLRLGEIAISISHSRDYAVVVAVGETSEDGNA
jgi:holo-[acyl-carrier protein] synthase